MGLWRQWGRHLRRAEPTNCAKAADFADAAEEVDLVGRRHGRHWGEYLLKNRLYVTPLPPTRRCVVARSVHVDKALRAALGDGRRVAVAACCCRCRRRGGDRPPPDAPRLQRIDSVLQ